MPNSSIPLKFKKFFKNIITMFIQLHFLETDYENFEIVISTKLCFIKTDYNIYVYVNSKL